MTHDELPQPTLFCKHRFFKRSDCNGCNPTEYFYETPIDLPPPSLGRKM